MTEDIGKTVFDDISQRTTRELLSQKGRTKRTTFGLVDWYAVDKITENSPPTVLSLDN